MAITGETTGSGDSADVAVSAAVVESVSAVTETPALELPPLGSAIDADALDALFAERTTTTSVRFRYAGRVVTVHADRTVEVSPAE